MASCYNCSHELGDDAQFCSNCGTQSPIASPAPAAGQAPTSTGPDNISAPYPDGGTASSPVTPEPNWQPQYGDPTAAPVRASAPEQPGFVADPQYGQPVDPQATAFVAAQPGNPQYAAAPGADGTVAGPPTQQGASPQYGGAAGADGPFDPNFVPVGSDSEKSGGVGKLVGVGLAVVGIAIVGFLAFRFIGGSDDIAGGASSPEAVVEELVAAVNAQDAFAAVSLMAPDEFDGLGDVVENAQQYFEQLGLGELDGGDIGASSVQLDVEVDAIESEMEGDNAAIVSFELSGDLEVTGDDDMLTALGEGDVRFSPDDFEAAFPNGSDSLEVIVVKLDGKWFLSPMLSVGHVIAENTDIGTPDYQSIGESRGTIAESPIEAVEAFIDVINDPDADDLSAVLGGGEGRVVTVFKDAIDDAFRDIDTGETQYELSADLEDIGNGRVELTTITLEIRDDFSDGTITIEDGCAELRSDGERERQCFDDLGTAFADVDTTIWLDTESVDGGYRVRVVPTFIDVLDRILTSFDRQTLLYAAGTPYLDDATEVPVGSDVDIEFDGQLYAVHEFEVIEGEWYNIDATGDSQILLYTDRFGDGLEEQFSTTFQARRDGMARVVTTSELDDEFCGGPSLDCLPNGKGATTLRIRRAAQQSAPFPTIISGDLGPSDQILFTLDVTSRETVFIDVSGDVRWELVDGRDAEVDIDTYDLTPGTYELVVTNTSAEESTSYTITPSAG